MSIILNIATLLTGVCTFTTALIILIERRSKLVISISSADDYYYFYITNIGKQVAWDIKISIDSQFIEDLPNDGRIKDILRNIQRRNFFYVPGVSKAYIFIKSSQEDPTVKDWFRKYGKKEYWIEVQYNQCRKTKLKFTLEQFQTEASILSTSQDRIVDAIKSLEDTIHKTKK